MKVKRSKPKWLLLHGDAIDKMRDMPAKSVHCVVTSPPYWLLRSYRPDILKLRDGLTKEERLAIETELARLGVKPILV